MSALARGEKPHNFFLDTKEQPYLTAENRPFSLTRVWGHGGKTNVWGRVSLRYSDLDFQGPARDGWEIPWPIAYKDIAPYYDKVDELIGVYGGDDDSDALPGSKFFLPPPAPRCSERIMMRAAKGLGMPIVAGRRANMTRSVRGFPPCHYCGKCGRGCDTGSFFCSADHLLPFALETKKLEIRSNAVAARVLVDDRGMASGVQYFDRVSGKEQRVNGKVIVVAASCVDSTRILLNSKSERYPNGIGNSSDAIGRYLCEQIRLNVKGQMPALYGSGYKQDYGADGEHIYMPRFNHRAPHKRDYLRGFGMQFWGSSSIGNGVPFYGRTIPGFGASLKKEIKNRYPAWVEIHPFGEVLPYAHNRITVDRVEDRQVRRAAVENRLSHWRKRKEDDGTHVRRGRGARQGVRRGAGELPPQRSRRDGLRHPRALHLPHGRGSEARAAQQVQSDARREERLRRRRLVLHDGQREEPDADDPRAVVARDRLPRRGNEARQLVIAQGPCVIS